MSVPTATAPLREPLAVQELGAPTRAARPPPRVPGTPEGHCQLLPQPVTSVPRPSQAPQRGWAALALLPSESLWAPRTRVRSSKAANLRSCAFSRPRTPALTAPPARAPALQPEHSSHGAYSVMEKQALHQRGDQQ